MVRKSVIIALVLPLLVIGCVGSDEPQELPSTPSNTQDSEPQQNSTTTPAAGCDNIKLMVADCYFSDKQDTVFFKLANLGTESFNGSLKVKASFKEYSAQEITANASVSPKDFKEIKVTGFNQPNQINSLELSSSCLSLTTLDFCPNLLEDKQTQLEVEIRFDKHTYKAGESGKATIIITDTVPQNYQAEYPDVLNNISYSFDPVGTTIQSLRQKNTVTDFAYDKPNSRDKDFSVDKYAEPGFHKFKFWLDWHEGNTDETVKNNYAVEHSILVVE